MRSLGFANFAFVWGAVISLGFAWSDGTLTRTARTAWAMACGGVLSLVVLVAFFDYPVSMIDLTHAPRSNAQPPSLALLALAIAQCGVMLLFNGLRTAGSNDRGRGWPSWWPTRW